MSQQKIHRQDLFKFCVTSLPFSSWLGKKIHSLVFSQMLVHIVFFSHIVIYFHIY